MTTPLREAILTANERVWDEQKDGQQTRRKVLRVLSLPDTASEGACLETAAGVLSSQGLSSSTINRHIAAFRAAWRVAQEQGLVAKPPPPWRSRREPLGRLRSPSRTEVAVQLLRLKAIRVESAVLARLLAMSGLRVGEALALTHDDVSTSHGVKWLRVNDGKTGARSVPVKPNAVRLPRGLTYSTFMRDWSKARARERWFVPHTLRHFRASELSAGGTPVPTIAAILGHADWRTTVRYTHVDAAGMARAVLGVA